jgi:alpha-glucosidase
VEAKGDRLVYLRRHGERAFLIALNFAAKPQAIDFSHKATGASIVLSTHLDRAGEFASGRLALRGEEGLLVRVI